MAEIDQAAREELRLTLHVVPRWQLSADGWNQIEQILRDIASALESDDRRSFFRSLRQIDDAGPPRLARLGADDDAMRSGSPPPAPVVELVNSLVHAPPTGGQAPLG